MASYEGMDALIGLLKQASIDAWMRSQGWRRFGDHYEMSTRQAHHRVSAPGVNGEGGGDWAADNGYAERFGIDRDNEFCACFDAVRVEIDGLLGRWCHLPAPEKIDKFVEGCLQVAGGLAGETRLLTGALSAAGDLGGFMESIKHDVHDMNGTMIDAFKSKFVLQLERAIGGICVISILRGSAIAAERSLWGNARMEVVGIVEKATVAMKHAAVGGVYKWQDVLQVAGWAAAGAATFATGFAAPAIAAVGIGIDILKETTSSRENDDSEVSTYSDVLAMLKKSLDDLSDGIHSEEELIAQNLSENLERIRAHKSSFDLTPQPVEAGGDLNLGMPGLVEEITKRMVDVARGLAVIAKAALDCSTFSELRRDGSIGIDPCGPSWLISEYNWLLYELLNDLSWEVEGGAKLFEEAVRAIEDHDRATAAHFDALANRYAAGSGYDPWSTDRPEPRLRQGGPA